MRRGGPGAGEEMHFDATKVDANASLGSIAPRFALEAHLDGLLWKLRPRQVTGDTAYDTTENIAAVERAGIRAYVPLSGAGKARPYFSKEELVYDTEHDLYRCPAGEALSPRTKNETRRLTVYESNAGTCEACDLRPGCTDSKTGRQVLRYFEEAYVDRVRAYRGTFSCEKALRKRRVWVEPLFAEAKDRHTMRRFGLRRPEKVKPRCC